MLETFGILIELIYTVFNISLHLGLIESPYYILVA